MTLKLSLMTCFSNPPSEPQRSRVHDRSNEDEVWLLLLRREGEDSPDGCHERCQESHEAAHGS